MKFRLWLLLSLIPGLAWAQGVNQSGTVTPGHPTKWIFDKTIGDAGGAASGSITELGITNTGTPFCINDAPITAGGGYHQLCFGANSLNGGLLSYNAKGGAQPLPFQCLINGVTESCLTAVPNTGLPFVVNNAELKALSPGQFGSVMRLGFNSQGDTGPLVYNWSAACPGAVDNGLYVAPGVSNPGCWVASFVDGKWDVTEWGADKTGAADSAPIFRTVLAQASNKYVVVPPGTYMFCSQVPSGYPFLGTPNVRMTNQSNFTLDMQGATFQMCDTANSGSMFEIDATTPGAAGNFKVLGGTFIGNRTGMVPVQENCAIVPVSVHDFSFQGQLFTGNWGGISAAFCGDWQVNGSYRDITALTAGQCFDYAFLQNVSFDSVRCYGADADGTAGTDKVGSKGFSFIYDPPAVGTNNSGYTIQQNDGVFVSNSSATNFIQGWLVTSGVNFTFTNNKWYNNPGCSGGAVGTCLTWAGFINFYGSVVNASSGFGGAILYDGNGSVLHPPGNIVSQGEHYYHNGNAVWHGSGIFVSGNIISNSDTISDIIVSKSTFVGNDHNAVDTFPSAANKILNVALDTVCTTELTVQTACIGFNMITIKNPLSPLGIVGFDSQTGFRQGFANTVDGNGASYRSSGLSTTTGGVSVAIAPGTCGTSPGLVGNNLAGQIFVGTGANGDTCTLNFSAPWNQTPACIPSSNQAARPVYTSNTSTTAVSFSGNASLSAGDLIVYQCSGYQ